MEWAALAYPFSLGLVAAFNPCGFALLPAYLSYFIGAEPSKDSPPASGAQALGAMLRAMLVALTLTAGFVAVFGAFGLLFETVLSQGTVLEHIGYVTIAIGVAMALLGVWMLTGRAINVRLPKMSRGTGSRGLASMFMFGVSYAVASLSCTIGLFVAAVAASFSADGVANGTANFVAYGIGMGAVMTFLTLALALTRTSVVPAMRKMFRWINPISGLVLIASGVYVANYGWWELQIIDDPLATNVLVEKFTEFQAAVTNWIDDATAERLGVLCALGVIGALVLAWRQGESPRASAPPDSRGLRPRSIWWWSSTSTRETSCCCRFCDSWRAGRCGSATGSPIRSASGSRWKSCSPRRSFGFWSVRFVGPMHADQEGSRSEAEHRHVAPSPRLLR